MSTLRGRHRSRRAIAGWRGILILCGAALAAAAGVRPVAGEEGAIACRISRAGEEAVEVSWQDAGDQDGYWVDAAADLAQGDWRHAGNIDYWPAGETNWVGSVDAPAAFYRAQLSRRGRLVGHAVQQTITTGQIGLLLSLLGIGGITPTYPVAVHQLTYETFDHRGQSTLATGALCIPVGPATAPLVSCQHGTIFESSKAPSTPGANDQAVGIAFATEGYVVALPDYLGLGPESPPPHPYLHARSEAVASVDLLRATVAHLAGGSGPAPDGHLFLIGYSQGGHATLALQRELEIRHAGEFPVTASAPMAGPHDLSGVMREFVLTDTPYDSPSYIAYLLFGLNSVYRLFDSASDILVSPYDTTLPPLFDGAHSSGEVNAAMPTIPKQIFQAAFLADFQDNPGNPLRHALRANDTYPDWLPAAPTRLYHCAGDTTVPKANSERAVADFIARGATTVSLHDPAPAADHGGGVLPCHLAAKAWFDSLR